MTRFAASISSALILAASFTLAAGAQAQISSSNDTGLTPIVVSATRMAQRQTDALPFTTVITAEDIRNSQAVDLPALLRHETGVQFTQNGGIGSTSGLFMRGAETRQTLILLDGVPLTKQDASGSVSVEHLMLDQIDHIEIVRGNVSSIYGSSAIGGVVQIFTRRGDGPARMTAEAEAGSRGTTRIASGVTGGTSGPDAVRFAFNVSNFQTNGFSALNPAQVRAANPDRDGYHNSSASGSLSRDFGKDHQAGINFSATEGRFAFDSSFGVPTDIQTGKSDVGTVSLFSQNRFNDQWLSRVTYSESRDRNLNHYDTSYGVTNDRYQSRTRMVQWTNEVALSTQWSATAGAERQWQGLNSDNGYGDRLDVNRNGNSVFAGVQGKLGDHQLQANMRHDQLDRSESASTGYFGYGYLLSSHWKGLASIATGFAAPPLGYLYAPGYGNPGLKPEHSRSAEIGLQYTEAATLLRAALFDTRTRQQLVYDPVANMFSNIARVRNQGLELSGRSKLKDTTLGASLTLQDPRDESTDTRLRRRAKTLTTVSAAHHFGPWQVGADVSLTGSRPDGTAQLASYVLVNFNGRYSLSKSTELYARVDNVLDRTYQTAFGYNQPPRGVFAGIRWTP